MTHTPGPWRLGWGRADYLDVEAYFLDDEAWYAIASIDLDEHGAKPTPEQEANARLIAAAPDLVAACEMARFLFVEGNDVFEGLQEATAYMKKTKVALDKALAKCNCREGLDEAV